MHVRWIKRKNRRIGEFEVCCLCETKRVRGKKNPQNKTIKSLGQIAVKPTRSQREVFWEDVARSIEQCNIPTEIKAAIEATIAQKVPRGRNPHGDSDACVEWYTPEFYIRLVKQVLGKISLDPATNALAQTWIEAEFYYTAIIDGFNQKWFGKVFLNPPYGKNQPLKRKAPDWLERAIAAYEHGEIEEAIILLNRTGAAWYKKLLKRASALCEVEKRIPFIDATGKQQDSPRYYNDFIYLGKNTALFEEVFSEIGDVRIISVDSKADSKNGYSQKFNSNENLATSISSMTNGKVNSHKAVVN